MSHGRLPSHYPRARWTSPLARTSPRNPTVQVAPTSRRARVRHRKSAAIAEGLIELLVASLLARANRRCTTGSPVWFGRPRGFATAGAQQYHAQACSLGVPERQAAQPHRADPCAWSGTGAVRRTHSRAPSDVLAQITARTSARFGPRPMTDSPLSARSTPLHDPLRRLRGRFASFRRPQTGETVKNIRAHPKTPEAARLRPARTSITARGFACRRGPEVARDASHGQDLSNSREHGQLSLARNWPSSLTKTKLV